ncbi:MAG: hypothetical protein K1X72_25335 [Pyrinomonadaceae bacterium]|nr:hypothetical protein [Pyrinomonadaceae bacterium]
MSKVRKLSSAFLLKFLHHRITGYYVRSPSKENARNIMPVIQRRANRPNITKADFF